MAAIRGRVVERQHSGAIDRHASAVTSRAFVFFLLITAVISGALVMVIEVLGSRVVGPFFGVSLFVWTSLISVTLIALAAGYAVGGVLADRWRSPDYLYLIILVAGILTILVPVMKADVLKAAVPLGLRTGSFVSTLVLFGPALFLLGCVSPYLVKITAREMRNIARTVGGLYALSTAGSVIGTVVTGFVLIAYLGVNRIFYTIGALLVALAVCYFVFFGRRSLAVFAVAALLGFAGPQTTTNVVMDNGTRVTVVANRDSFYGNLKVVDYTYGRRHTRELIIDGLIQGGVDMGNGLPIYEYAYLLQWLPFALNPQGTRSLVLGLGPGLISPWYERRGVRADVVEIDPEVAQLAKDYFDFSHTGDLVIADARYFLSTTERRYDYVISDVFTGDTTPSHLLSLEVFRLIKQRMKRGAVLAINIAGSHKTNTYMTASVIETLKRVFEQVDAYPAFDVQKSDFGNFILVAYDGPARVVEKAVIRSEKVHEFARNIVLSSVTAPVTVPARRAPMVLTDDYNPIDFFDAEMREAVRREVLSGTHWDILIQ